MWCVCVCVNGTTGTWWEGGTVGFFYLIFNASVQLSRSWERSGSWKECSGLPGTRLLIWQADFLANHASSSAFPTFFALPSFVTAEVKTYFLFKGQLLSSVAMTIDEACWRGLFEECELFFFFTWGGQPVNESPSSFSGRLDISHHTCIGSCSSERARRASPRPSAPFGRVCVSGVGGFLQTKRPVSHDRKRKCRRWDRWTLSVEIWMNRVPRRESDFSSFPSNPVQTRPQTPQLQMLIQLPSVCRPSPGSRTFSQPVRTEPICCGLGLFAYLRGARPTSTHLRLTVPPLFRAGAGPERWARCSGVGRFFSSWMRESSSRKSLAPPPRTQSGTSGAVWEEELRKEDDSEIPAESSHQEGKHQERSGAVTHTLPPGV